MNNKKLVIFSFVSLILFGLILNFVWGTDHLASTPSFTVTGDGYGIDNWTKGGTNAIINFTLNFNAPDSNITNITILIPNNVIVPDLADDSLRVTNGSFTEAGTWDCTNATGGTFQNVSYIDAWECVNTTAAEAIGNATTMNIWFNFTTNSTGTEEPLVWTISTTDGLGQVNTTRLSNNVDDLAPRLWELNISDGYTTLNNNTMISIDTLTDDSTNESIQNGTLRADGSLSLTITYVDAGAGASSMATNNVYLYYLTNDTNINSTTYENHNGSTNLALMTTSDTSSPYRFTGVVGGLIENNITTFLLVVNDSFGNKFYQNFTEGGAISPYSVLTNTTNVPVLTLVNISAGDYNISSLSGGYLIPGSQTITITASGRDLFGIDLSGRNSAIGDGIFLYYNTTGNLTTGTDGYVSGMDASDPLLLDNNSISDYSAIYYSNSSFDIASGNDTNTIYYAIVANNTNGTYYTLLTGQYIIDNSAPYSTAIASNPADNKINRGESITFTCSASEDGVGVGPNVYRWKVTRGGESEVTLYDQTSTLTLSSTSSPNTNKIDAYTIKCIPYDTLGHPGTEKSITLTVSSTSGGTTAGAGGGGGAVTPSFDVDLSTSTTGSISGSVGRIKSFSFDGNTKHTVTFKEITATSAKITIASTPIDIILNVGETKKVDLNADGTNDLEVTLDNIKFGTNAEITIKKLETGAKKIVEEEKKASEEAAKVAEELAEEPTKGTGWLWITLLIIVVLVTVGYYVFKKKK